MNDSKIVEVSGLFKSFKKRAESRQSVLKYIISIFNNANPHQRFWALRDINLYIKKGETFGIIGPNGSGKTTLLKIMAGIFKQTRGRIIIRGDANFFFELGLGFHPDLSVRENTYLYGAFLGIGRKEINRKFLEIIDFAELKGFTDAKLFTLSPGMVLKLAFSIVRLTKGDIFVFDEIFSIGDLSFNRKIKDTLLALKKNGKTVIFVSNTPDKIKTFCDRCAYLDKGKLEAIGKTETVLSKYR